MKKEAPSRDFVEVLAQQRGSYLLEDGSMIDQQVQALAFESLLHLLDGCLDAFVLQHLQAEDLHGGVLLREFRELLKRKCCLRTPHRLYVIVISRAFLGLHQVGTGRQNIKCESVGKLRKHTLLNRQRRGNAVVQTPLLVGEN